MTELLKLIYETNEQQDLLNGDTYVLHVTGPTEEAHLQCQDLCGSTEYRCHVDPVRENDTYAAFCDCKGTHKYRFLRIMIRVLLVLGVVLAVMNLFSDVKRVV